MTFDVKNLPDDVEALKRIIESQNISFQKIIDSKTRELDIHKNSLREEKFRVELLEERIHSLESRLFSKKSEKLGPIEEIQSVLFNEIESLHDSEPELSLDEETVTVPEHTRTKKRRKSIPDYLPRREVIIDIDESEKVCGCGAAKSRIGEEVSEKVDYIPAKAFVRRAIRPKYACRKCQGTEDEGQPVSIAPLPHSLMGKSILAEGIFGHIIVSKFADGLPFHRQETILRRAGVEISRKVMATTAIRVAESLEPLRNLLLNEIKNAYLLGVDETRFQVLKEPGKRADQLSFLWHILAHTREGPVPVFLYRSDRSAKFLEDILGGFTGSVITDGYASYNFLDARIGIIHAGCNAHARRKFVEADKVSKGNPETLSVLNLYANIYKIESDWKKSSGDIAEIRTLRKEKSTPLMEKLKSKLDELSHSVNPSGNLGKAVSYTLDEWKRLTKFLDNPEIPIDNNGTENGIRPFVIGRKNWLFADTQSGAHASALYYTLIEGAKAAGLDPSVYMSYLLYNAPRAVTEEDWRALLPIKLKGKELILPG